MKHYKKQTPVERLGDLLNEIIEAIAPVTVKEWLVLIVLTVLLMAAVAQGDHINKLYGHVQALMEAAQ